MVVSRVVPDKTVYDPVVGVYMYTPYDPAVDTTLVVTNNVLQGSGSAGYVFPDIACELKDKIAFYDNEAGVTVDVGIVFNHPEGTGCAYAGRAVAYHSNKCIMFGANN